MVSTCLCNVNINNDGNRLNNIHGFKLTIYIFYTKVHHTSVYSSFGTLPEWVIFHELVHTKVSQIRDVSKVEASWFLDIAPHYYSAK